MELFHLWRVMGDDKHVIIRLYRSAEDAAAEINIIDSRAYSLDVLDTVEKIEAEAKAFGDVTRAQFEAKEVKTSQVRQRERREKESLARSLKEAEPQVAERLS